MAAHSPHVGPEPGSEHDAELNSELSSSERLPETLALRLLERQKQLLADARTLSLRVKGGTARARYPAHGAGADAARGRGTLPAHQLS